MQVFLVGGAIRDHLLGREIKDRDWVVVGATSDEMLEQGFQQVGKDFPVFLHPKSKEEYALARKERKVAAGYTGFETDTSKRVTLEEDLIRRDLTINAIAQDEHGHFVDPFNGQADLDNRILRHVSEAFIEDPLRVLRVARFAARYKSYGFTIAPETLQLMQQLCQTGELESLSAERVWVETAKAMSEDHPQIYFETLKDCGGLSFWFKELEQLWGVPNPAKWHPEIDTGIHVMMVLQQAAKLTNHLTGKLSSRKISIRFAALLHDLGKGITDPKIWPSHRGHEKAGLPLVNDLCQRLKTPNAERDLARLVCEYHGGMHKAFELRADTIVKLFNKTDAWRKPERFADFLLACEADARGRLNFEDRDYPQRPYLHECYQAARDVSIPDILATGVKGRAIKDALHKKRIENVQGVKESFNKEQ